MRVYDFLFVYEVKNRELENVLLLKAELENRGYSVAMIESWDQRFHLSAPINARVVISFALYSTSTVNYISTFVNKCDKYVNLQWEQILTNGDSEKQRLSDNESVGVSGMAKYGCHISWGEKNYNKLVNIFNVNKKNVCLAGNITLDFLRPEFKGYYYTREQLIEKYRIEKYKKIYLFISSFNFVNLPNELLKSDLYTTLGYDANDFQKLSAISQEEVLAWIEKELIKYPDILMIYRPHPAENDCKNIFELENKYNNFKIIEDYSVKQWILIVDKIYTWWSTSIAEVYIAGKSCSILRPFKIPYESEIEYYNDANLVNSFIQFDNEYLDKVAFPIPSEIINDYYFIDSEEASFIKICNFLIEVLNEDNYKIPGLKCKKINLFSRLLYNVKMNMKVIIFENKPLRLFLKFICKKGFLIFGRTYDAVEEEYIYERRMYKRNTYIKKEVKEKYNNILHFVKIYHNCKD